MLNPFLVSQQVLKKFLALIKYPTVTIEYPYVKTPYVKLSRLQIRNDFNECTVCLKCENACPVKAIKIVAEEYSDQVKKPQNSKGQPFVAAVTDFQIDYAKCVFCGICVESCPAESLKFDKHYFKPQLNEGSLKCDLVHIPRSMRRDETSQ